ncbi:MAG: matrixin family metalloprotease [Gammaproteobacteria bacterium]
MLAVLALLAFALERMGYLPGTLDRAFAHTACGIPVHYVLGEVDARFEFDRFTVTAALVEAANLWQSTTGQLLFIESDHPLAMTVELRFDQRQQAANTRRSLRGGLERDRRQLAEEEAALVRWNDRIEVSRQAHDRAGEALALRVRAHEAEVRDWNTSPERATDARRRALEAERLQLQAEVAELERAGESLNADIAAYNRRAADLRQRSEEFLSRVARYNETAADGPVESGRYSYDRTQGRRIEVYRAESYDELVWVLAHELGHALAIDHVADPGAVMNAMLHDGGELQPGRARPVALAEADLEALHAVCGERLR